MLQLPALCPGHSFWLAATEAEDSTAVAATAAAAEDVPDQVAMVHVAWGMTQAGGT